MEPTIYKPSIYKGAGVYKIGGGDGPVWNIPNEFEILEKPIYIKYNYKYSYGTTTSSEPNNYSGTGNEIPPIKNTGTIKIKFYKRDPDNIGGNRNYLFAVTDLQKTGFYYDSDYLIGAMLQHDHLYIKNGSTSYDINNRNNYLHGGLNEIIIKKDKCFVNGTEFTIPFEEKTVKRVYPFPMKQDNGYTDGTNANGPSLGFISLEIYNEADVLHSYLVTARRIADDRIGVIETSGPTFIQNNTNDSLDILQTW